MSLSEEVKFCQRAHEHSHCNAHFITAKFSSDTNMNNDSTLLTSSGGVEKYIRTSRLSLLQEFPDNVVEIVRAGNSGVLC